MRLLSRGRNHDHGNLGIGKRGGGGAPVGALPSVTGPGDPVSASVAFLGRCGRRLRTEVAAWTPWACRGTLLVLRKDHFKVKTTLSFGDEDPVAAAAVLDTGARPSVVSEDLICKGSPLLILTYSMHLCRRRT